MGSGYPNALANPSGINTLSISWITPLLAPISATPTIAGGAFSLLGVKVRPLVTSIVISSPCNVVNEPSLNWLLIVIPSNKWYSNKDLSILISSGVSKSLRLSKLSIIRNKTSKAELFGTNEVSWVWFNVSVKPDNSTAAKNDE